MAVDDGLVLIGVPHGFVPHVGAAYLYDTRSGGLPVKLLPPTQDSDQWFGSSVAIDGALALVGAPHDDDLAGDAGSVYVFGLSDPGNPILLGELHAADAETEDYFGQSVTIEGDLTVVGMPMEHSSLPDPGAVYLFSLADPAAPEQLAKIAPPTPDDNGHFGLAVAICGNMIVIGEPGASDATGAAYAYDISDPQQPVLVGTFQRGDPHPSDYFGCSVACNGELAVVGAYLDDHPDQDSGSVFLFDLETCAEISQFSALDVTADQNYGVSVGISGDTVVVGAWQDCAAAWMAGAAYLVDISNPTAPDTFRKLIPCDAKAGAYFGHAAAIDGDIAVLGNFEDDDQGEESGAAYVYTKHWPTGCAGDITGDRVVDVLDLLAVLEDWGACP